MKNISPKRVFIGSTIFIVATWSATLLLLYLDNKNGIGDLGTFGDMFGAVNALFSGFALLGIILTILMQSKELRLQRDELKLQRNELKLTREEFKTQNATLKAQRFENTFFQMLNLHQEIIDKLHYVGKTVKVSKGFKTSNIHDVEKREVLRLAAEMLREDLDNIKDGFVTIPDNIGVMVDLKKSWKDMQDVYYEFYYSKGFGNTLSHYFLNLYHCFKFVYTSELETSEKKQYASLIRAQLTPDELFILFYNSMFANHGNPKFLFLIKEYKIMDNLNKDNIKDNQHKAIFDELIDNVKDVLSEEHPDIILPKFKD